jgi:hypothetical protein
MQRVRHLLGTNIESQASQLGVQQWPQRCMQSVQGEQIGGMSRWRRRWAGRQKAATSRRRRQWRRTKR